MPNISRNLAQQFPITAKLNPLHGENWGYLLKSAFVTRLAVGAVRVEENRPSRLKTTEMTPAEKKKAFVERLFVEMFGTTAYVFLLHLGQDVAARLVKSFNKNLVQKVKDDSLKEIASGTIQLDPERFSKAYDKVFGTNASHIFAKVLYGERNEKGEFIQAIRRNLCHELNIPVEEVNERLPKAINHVLRPRLNVYSTMVVLMGVLVSAVVGGYGIQWLNDHPLNTILRRKYPDAAPAGFLTFPEAFSSTQFGNGTVETPNPFSRLVGSSSTLFSGGGKS